MQDLLKCHEVGGVDFCFHYLLEKRFLVGISGKYGIYGKDVVRGLEHKLELSIQI